jgi:hypothetical protein
LLAARESITGDAPSAPAGPFTPLDAARSAPRLAPLVDEARELLAERGLLHESRFPKPARACAPRCRARTGFSPSGATTPST